MNSEYPDLQEVSGRIVAADALRDAGDIQGALVAYRMIVGDFPESAEAWNRLGAMHRKEGETTEAERCYRQSVSLRKDYPDANNNLALLLVERGNSLEAERYYRTALAENSDFLQAHINLGTLLSAEWRLLEAKYCANRAISIDPESPAAHYLLGEIHGRSGRLAASKLEFERAIELSHEFAPAWIGLGAYYRMVGLLTEAEAAFSSALEADPESFPAWNNLLLMSNHRVRDKDEVFKLHRAYGDLVRRQCGDLPIAYSETRPDTERRLRIGFISGDLRRNSVSYFLRGALEHLDRQHFELIAYYNFRSEDEVTAQLKPLFHRWRPIFGLGDSEAADLIRQDHVDVLVELNGHTAAFRPMVVGRKPAPIQAHWIGYPNTIGLDCIDYRITDSLADPIGEADRYHTERLWRMPKTFLCYRPDGDAPDVGSLPSGSTGQVTFGSFNSHAKYSDECIDLWRLVLEAVPNSRLVLKSGYGPGGDELRASVLEHFSRLGVDIGRIDLRNSLPTNTEHLAAYRDIDIALDTFPYHGTTTTCEALWMGVPVIALAGNSHAARVGVSLLNNAGLEELVAEQPQDYIRIAAELARDRERLAQLRATMRERMLASPLLDRCAMGRDLGEAFREMWRRYCSGFSPAAFVESLQASEPEDLLRLHIGGRTAREGWKILDVETREEVDFVGDIRDLELFADESCAEIYCSHVLEHVGQTEILDTLNGLYRLLAPKGRFYVSVPDLDVLTLLFANQGMSKAGRFAIMRMMFGGQVDGHDFHKIGLNIEFMTDYLKDVGFSDIQHVESFGLFDDDSELRADGHLLSLNLIATK